MATINVWSDKNKNNLLATNTTNKPPTTTPSTTGATSSLGKGINTLSTIGSTGTASSVNPTVTYGSNVTNFDPNNAQHVALANAGQDWWKAKNAGDAQGMAAAETLGQNIRSGLQGSTFDANKGISSLGAAATGQYGATDVQNEIAQQLAAYNAQLASAKNLADYQSGQNQQYLQEALAGLNSSEAVALDQAQQIQNRFGGLYSGGLPYQSAEINRSFAGQRGALSRDIAGRNQQIYDQYGTQANQIASNIAQLQATSPQVIRDRLLEYQLQTAPITGTFNGAPTMASKEFEEGKSQWSKQFDEDKRRYGEQFAYQQARDKIEDAEQRRQFDTQVQQNGLDRAVQWYNAQTNRMQESRMSSSGGGGGGSTKAPAVTTVMNNVNKLFGTYDNTTRKYVVDPAQQANIVAYVSNQFPDDEQYDEVIDLILGSYGIQPGTGQQQNLYDRPVSGMVPSE